MNYKSELIKEIVETRGHHLSSPHYESECVESWIEETKGAYPKLCDYESEWLNYIIETPLGDFSYETVSVVKEATVDNVVPYAYKSAILTGQTLVNLASEKDIEFTKVNEWKHLKLNQSLLNSSKKYLVSFDSSQNYKGYVHLRDISNNTYITSADITSIKQGNNKLLINNFLQTELNTFADIRATFYLNNDSVVIPTISNVILLEYVEGMENWDIPYFEGMQSVKMPVLTNTGKNLFKGETIGADTMNGDEIYFSATYNKTGAYLTIDEGMIGKTYTISCYAKRSPSNHFVVIALDENGNELASQQQPLSTEYQYITQTITIPRNTVKLLITIAISGMTRELWIKQLQIEENTTATSYEPHKSNILTVNEDVPLRSNGSVCDELDLLTGKLTQRIDEDGSVLTQEVVKTVALTSLNKPYKGTNHYHLTANIPCEAILEVPVVSTEKQTIEEINN